MEHKCDQMQAMFDKHFVGVAKLCKLSLPEEWIKSCMVYEYGGVNGQKEYWFGMGNAESKHLRFPINFCPFCGADLRK